MVTSQRRIYSQSMLKAMIVLTGFVILGVGAVAFTFAVTAPKIKSQEQRKLLSDLSQILDAHHYDNQITQDTITLRDPLLGKGEYTAFRARLNQQNSAVILQAETASSYSGTPIKLLVGIYKDGSLSGVRVTSHKETPGLGDAIMIERSNWINSFKGKSLDHPRVWAVKKDGGEFDQFTGATITPRAVVNGVHNALKFYAENKSSIFEYKTPPHNHDLKKTP